MEHKHVQGELHPLDSAYSDDYRDENLRSGNVMRGVKPRLPTGENKFLQSHFDYPLSLTAIDNE